MTKISGPDEFRKSTRLPGGFSGIIADGPRIGQRISGIVPLGFAMRTTSDPEDELDKRMREDAAEAPKRKPAIAPYPPVGYRYAHPLDELDDILSKRMVMGEAQRTVSVLWTAHTYIFDRGFKWTGKLFVTGSSPACGKTELMDLLTSVSNGGVLLESGTTMATIRDFKRDGGRTLGLDQLDNTKGHIDNDDRKIVNLLCSSSRVGAKRLHKEMVGKQWKTASVDVGIPTLIGMIGRIPNEALMSRSFIVQMFKETKEERREQIHERMKPLDWRGLRARFEGWLKSVKSRPEYIEAPAGVDSRTEDIWQPLLAVAKLAGGEWPQRAVEAMLELEGSADEGSENQGLMWLRTLYHRYKKRTDMGIPSADVDGILGLSGGKADATKRGMGLSSMGLMTKRRTWSPGMPQVNGYLFDDIRKAAKRQGIK